MSLFQLGSWRNAQSTFEPVCRRAENQHEPERKKERTDLEERVTSHNLEEPLESFAPRLDHLVREPAGVRQFALSHR